MPRSSTSSARRARSRSAGRWATSTASTPCSSCTRTARTRHAPCSPMTLDGQRSAHRERRAVDALDWHGQAPGALSYSEVHTRQHRHRTLTDGTASLDRLECPKWTRRTGPCCRYTLPADQHSRTPVPDPALREPPRHRRCRQALPLSQRGPAAIVGPPARSRREACSALQSRSPKPSLSPLSGCCCQERMQKSRRTTLTIGAAAVSGDVERGEPSGH